MCKWATGYLPTYLPTQFRILVIWTTGYRYLHTQTHSLKIEFKITMRWLPQIH